MAEIIKDVINRNLKELKTQGKEKLLKARYDKFRAMGKFA
jgi:acetyl-CoA carboxylase alpha subunit